MVLMNLEIFVEEAIRSTIVASKYSGVVETLVEEFNPYFDFEEVPDLNRTRQQILSAEGCVVCGKQYIPEYVGKYMILRCKLMHCEHIIVLDDLQEKNINGKSKCFMQNFISECVLFENHQSINTETGSLFCWYKTESMQTKTA